MNLDSTPVINLGFYPSEPFSAEIKKIKEGLIKCVERIPNDIVKINFDGGRGNEDVLILDASSCVNPSEIIITQDFIKNLGFGGVFINYGKSKLEDFPNINITLTDLFNSLCQKIEEVTCHKVNLWRYNISPFEFHTKCLCMKNKVFFSVNCEVHNPSETTIQETFPLNNLTLKKKVNIGVFPKNDRIAYSIKSCVQRIPREMLEIIVDPNFSPSDCDIVVIEVPEIIDTRESLHKYISLTEKIGGHSPWKILYRKSGQKNTSVRFSTDLTSIFNNICYLIETKFDDKLNLNMFKITIEEGEKCSCQRQFFSYFCSVHNPENRKNLTSKPEFTIYLPKDISGLFLSCIKEVDINIVNELENCERIDLAFPDFSDLETYEEIESRELLLGTMLSKGYFIPCGNDCFASGYYEIPHKDTAEITNLALDWMQKKLYQDNNPETGKKYYDILEKYKLSEKVEIPVFEENKPEINIHMSKELYSNIKPFIENIDNIDKIKMNVIHLPSLKFKTMDITFVPSELSTENLVVSFYRDSLVDGGKICFYGDKDIPRSSIDDFVLNKNTEIINYLSKEVKSFLEEKSKFRISFDFLNNDLRDKFVSYFSNLKEVKVECGNYFNNVDLFFFDISDVQSMEFYDFSCENFKSCITDSGIIQPFGKNKHGLDYKNFGILPIPSTYEELVNNTLEEMEGKLNLPGLFDKYKIEILEKPKFTLVVPVYFKSKLEGYFEEVEDVKINIVSSPYGNIANPFLMIVDVSDVETSREYYFVSKYLPDCTHMPIMYVKDNDNYPDIPGMKYSDLSEVFNEILPLLEEEYSSIGFDLNLQKYKIPQKKERKRFIMCSDFHVKQNFLKNHDSILLDIDIEFIDIFDEHYRENTDLFVIDITGFTPEERSECMKTLEGKLSPDGKIFTYGDSEVSIDPIFPNYLPIVCNGIVEEIERKFNLDFSKYKKEIPKFISERKTDKPKNLLVNPMELLLKGICQEGMKILTESEESQELNFDELMKNIPCTVLKQIFE